TAAALGVSLLGHPVGDPTLLPAQRLAAESSVETLSDKQYTLERQIVEQKRQVAEEEKLAALAPRTGGARAGSSYGVLLVRKAELEAQLKEYSTQYTAKNPKVMQARTQLAEIDRQLAQLEAADGQGAGAGSTPAR